MIDVETLRKLLRYEPETGKLFWLPRDANTFKTPRGAKIWAARFPGKEAFTAADSHGYKKGSVNGRLYFAHRVAWAIHTGSWPAGQLDHINGVKSDNRTENLRMATGSQNQANGPSKGGTSRFKGVCWNKVSKKWQAQIMAHRRLRHLGLFDLEDDAARAYDAAAKFQFGDFARLNFPA